jgi:hypothetical protein
MSFEFMGIGDWGLGIGPSPIPNPHPHSTNHHLNSTFKNIGKL